MIQTEIFAAIIYACYVNNVVLFAIVCYSGLSDQTIEIAGKAVGGALLRKLERTENYVYFSSAVHESVISGWEFWYW